jgi:YVTN family beta-propeller protein
MRAIRTIRSAVAIASLASTLAAQNAVNTINPLISRRNDPPPLMTTAIDANGNYVLLAILFAPLGTKVEVAPILNIGPAESVLAGQAVAARARAQAFADAQAPDDAPVAIPPNGPGLNIPDPDEFGFDPWDLPDPPDPFMVPDAPSPFDDPPDPFGDPFGDLPNPPMDLPPLPPGARPADGGKAASSNSYSPNAFTVFNDNSVEIVNGSTKPASLIKIPVGRNPAGIVNLPDGSGAWVTNSGAGTVSVIQGTSVVATIPLPGVNLDGIAMTPDGTRAYVSNFDNVSQAVYVLDVASRKLIATLPAGPYPAIIRVIPDGSQAWVTSIYGNGLEVIDTATNTVIKTLGGMSGAWGLAFNPTGTRAYVAGSTSGTVYVLDTTTFKIVATIAVGPEPRDIVCTGRFLFVTDMETDSITQVDVRTNKVVRTITVGPGQIDVGFLTTTN